MNETIAKLVDLQKIDHRVLALKQKQDDLEGGLVSSKKGMEAAKAALDIAHKALLEAKSLVHRKELDVQERETKIRDLNGKLGGATSNKEYQGLVLAIAEQKAENGKTETEILMAMDDVEAKDKLHEAAKANMRAAEATMAEAQAKIAAQKTAIQSDAIAAIAERIELVMQIPPDAVKIYERIRGGNKKSGTAVAVVHGEYCQGCQMGITPQELSDLIQGTRIMLCRTCQRILVLET